MLWPTLRGWFSFSRGELEEHSPRWVPGSSSNGPGLLEAPAPILRAAGAAAGLWGEPELAQEPSRAALRQHPSSLVGTPETLTIPQQEEA